MTDAKRQLLQRLASEGKATTLSADEIQIAKSLEAEELVFIIRDTPDAIITPKGRHMLANLESGARPEKKPFGFIE